jgi:hypothetical protein
MLNSLSQSRHKEEMQQLLALDPARPFEVHSLRPARRVGPDGQLLSDLVIEITQQRPGYFDADVQKTMDERAAASDKSVTVKPDFAFRGGCTLILDTNTSQVRYSIYKNVCSDTRLARQRDYMASEQSMSLRMTYFGEGLRREPFALLHRAADWDKEGMEWAL